MVNYSSTTGSFLEICSFIHNKTTLQSGTFEYKTEKMRYTEKFNSGCEAKIHLVWEEWFWDSLDFGGRFEEEKYDVRKPRPERKTIVEGNSISSFGYFL
jgi:hypothetical protein